MKEFPKPSSENSKDYYLSKSNIIELYNSDFINKKHIDSDVCCWIELQAFRHGWKNVKWKNEFSEGDGLYIRCCYLSTEPAELPTIKQNPIENIENSISTLLTGAITRIAQHACRQGEANSRVWPDLNNLPEPKSWEMVGKKYAREIAIDIMRMYFDKGTFLKDLAKLAGND